MSVKPKLKFGIEVIETATAKAIGVEAREDDRVRHTVYIWSLLFL